MADEIKSGYQSSLKSLDTEEHIDLWFYRPIGYAWACLAKRLGITPNAITIASIFLGVGAGIAFYYTSLWINILGIVLLVWANSFDSADGQLARMTKQYSRIGRILDGVSGDLWFISIYIAICLRENATSPFFMEHPWAIWALASVSGIFHAKQAATADYYRQFHLYFLKGEEGSELDSSAQLRARYSEMPWRGHFWAKLTLLFYTNYTANQEALAPAMQRLRAELRRVFPSGVASPAFRDAFRKGSLPLMKYTNILSFNWRSIALFVTILAGVPWLYFIFELVVLNAILLYMIVRHENLCRRLTRELEKGDFR
ncbi:MAG: CDP-alcohol phosphatidyltransferase family protein [Muribaculaceae bacterium]|nr:CDP-alcohol phosphatidyltransferase family protein [Muribaculaceae bacterium]